MHSNVLFVLDEVSVDGFLYSFLQFCTHDICHVGLYTHSYTARNVIDIFYYGGYRLTLCGFIDSQNIVIQCILKK